MLILEQEAANDVDAWGREDGEGEIVGGIVQLDLESTDCLLVDLDGLHHVEFLLYFTQRRFQIGQFTVMHTGMLQKLLDLG